eukprot:CAMPEP_0114503122 /NCGR_PEP_ID=MMETSP0109-20121206/9475_1 /TAXON_ID=29199 /ORGANISM="Chlorarachnion reptans, Strain CCCM449" /LENGTH=511 /DNA_ID=CAMNT_0001681121 /DNA_START=44 /DNA_END=1579 /DNA_ORIENTATION=-
MSGVFPLCRKSLICREQLGYRLSLCCLFSFVIAAYVGAFGELTPSRSVRFGIGTAPKPALDKSLRGVRIEPRRASFKPFVPCLKQPIFKRPSPIKPEGLRGFAEALSPNEREVDSFEKEDYFEDESEEDEEVLKQQILTLQSEPFGRTTSDVKDSETVHIFPSFAFQHVCSETGKARWSTRLSGRTVQQNRRYRRRRAGMSSAARALGFYPSTEREREMYTKRMDLFTLRAAKRRWVALDMGMGVWWTTSGANGLFNVDVQLSPDSLAVDVPAHGKPVPMDVTTIPTEDGRIWNTKLFFVPPSGFSIISDIDDTIKLTEVGNTKRMLSNTFLYPFAPVDGMSQLYQYFKQQGAAFHYVSNSPWQLQPELEDFVGYSQFPEGTFHLKQLSFGLNKPLTFLKNRLLRSKPPGNETNHKHSTILKILKTFPARKFILIGDSGEKDPIIYADIAENFPKQIGRVYIRKVPGDKRGDEHWQHIFRGVDSGKWHVFDESSSIRKDVEQLLSTDSAYR